jgi:hypothetical protein
LKHSFVESYIIISIKIRPYQIICYSNFPIKTQPLFHKDKKSAVAHLSNSIGRSRRDKNSSVAKEGCGAKNTLLAYLEETAGMTECILNGISSKSSLLLSAKK